MPSLPQKVAVTPATPVEQVDRESIDISDFSDEEIADLITGVAVFNDLILFETHLGNYDASQGQEFVGVFKRTDNKFFQYIWLVDLNDNYSFFNIPELVEVFPTQKMVTVYE